jgi:hypothetical protein
MNPINRTESGLVKTGFGSISGIVVNSHTSGTLALIDGTEAGVAASSVLTSAGAMVPATHATSEVVSSGAMVAGTHAVSVLTADTVANGNVVVIGSITYTAKTVLTGVAYEVLIGANDQAFLVNLKAAINGEAGRGTLYSSGTIKNTQVVCVASDATTLTVRGRVPGTSLNAVATTGTALRTVWADTTLGGGTGASDAGVTTGAATITIGTTVYTVVDELSENYGAAAVAYQVKKGANEAAMLDNLKLAINGTGTAGTNYSTGTVAHPSVVATTNTDTVQTIRGRVPGTSLNTTATTTTMANTAWADTTLGGGTGNSDAGVTTAGAQFAINGRTYTAVIELSESLGASAIADQILWVTSEAVFLDKVKLAINASGIAGTDYSTGTTVNYDVIATTNTNTEQTIVARNVGTAGNSITTTEALANYSWTSTVLTSGTGATGTVIFPTITFAAGPGFYEIPGGASFTRGLYATVGGTLNYTLLVE